MEAQDRYFTLAGLSLVVMLAGAFVIGLLPVTAVGFLGFVTFGIAGIAQWFGGRRQHGV